MCTVTFITSGDSIFLTSNRDEKVQRSQALPPKYYQVNNTSLLYPKDADAGGTWVALKENNNAAVLLNGAFANHIPAPPYRRSRGLILLNILAALNPLTYFRQTNLLQIEPFTLILLLDFLLYECRWDGHEKYDKQLSTAQNHIWSSATLYNRTVQQKREEWFAKWLGNNSQPSQTDIFNFHQFGGDGDEQNDIRMNRNGTLFTVSITGIQLNKERSAMRYLDLKDGATYTQQINRRSYTF